jgi:ankyrin repeat protein
MTMRTDIFLMQYLAALNLPVLKMKCENGYTLLHYAVLNLRPDTIHALVHFAKDTQKEPQEKVEAWINQKSDGNYFTPLHFAAFKGHFGTIQSLIDHGANLYEVNDFGLNVLHVAA